MSDDQMLKDHQETWHGFIKLCTYSVVAVAVVLALMWAFLV